MTMGRLILKLWAIVYGPPAHTPIIWGGAVVTLPTPTTSKEQKHKGQK